MRHQWLLLSFFVCLSVCGMATAQDANVPSFQYSPDQQLVLNKYGNPFLFEIIFQQQGTFRYETWFYGGTIKKKFGFVNGTKKLEAPFKAPIANSSGVPGLTPDRF